MKQKKLLKKMYAASAERDFEKLAELRKLELEKIINRRQKGKRFDAKWTLADL